MTIGYAVRGKCYANLDVANQHFCSEVFPTVSGSTTQYAVRCVPQTGGTILFQNASGTFSSWGGGIATAWPHPSCNSDTFYEVFSPFELSPAQGSLVASAILAIWGCAWAIKMILRTISTDGEKE